MKLRIQIGVLIIGYISLSGGLGILYYSLLPESWYISNTSGRITMPGLQGRGVWIDNTLAYVADGEFGVRIINISSISQPNEIAYINVADSAECVATKESIAYIGSETELLTYNVTQPDSPVFLGNYSLNDKILDLVVGENNLVYLANNYDGLIILNCTNPSSITLTGSFDDSNFNAFSVHRLDVAKDVAYLTNPQVVKIASKGVQLVNISSPTNPTLIGYSKMWGNPNYQYSVDCQDIIIHDDYAFIADKLTGLVLLDVHDVPAVSVKSVLVNDIINVGVTIEGNMLYLLDYQNIFMIYDITDLNDPSLVGKFDVPATPKDIIVKNNIAYVVDREGLSVFLIEPGRSGIYYEEITDIWVIMPALIIVTVCFVIGFVDLFLTRSKFLD